MRMVAPPAGISPRLTSIWAKRQSSAATTISAASINSIPKVKQIPCTAHTNGFWRSGGRSDKGSMLLTGNTDPRSRITGATLSNSRPAVKLRPSANSRPTQAFSSASKAVNACANSISIFGEKPLSFLGRSMPMANTRSKRSVTMRPSSGADFAFIFRPPAVAGTLACTLGRCHVTAAPACAGGPRLTPSATDLRERHREPVLEPFRVIGDMGRADQTDQLRAKPGTGRRLHQRPAPLRPAHEQGRLLLDMVGLPAHGDLTARSGQGPVFYGIGRQFMHDEREHLGERTSGHQKLAVDLGPRAKRCQLGLDQVPQRRTAPRARGNELLRMRERVQATQQGLARAAEIDTVQ